MNTRKRAAYLRKLGYKKSPISYARNTLTYKHPVTGSVAMVGSGNPSGGPSIFTGGNLGLMTRALSIGNLKKGAAAGLQSVYDQGFNVPTTTDDDAMTPEWYDRLFKFLADVNSTEWPQCIPGILRPDFRVSVEYAEE